MNTGSMTCLCLKKTTAAEFYCSLFIVIYSKVGRLTVVLIKYEILVDHRASAAPSIKRVKLNLPRHVFPMKMFVKNHVTQC